MRELKLQPRVQIWVCVNERSHLELPSCIRLRGEAIVACIQEELLKLPAEKRQNVWVNRTLCQGSCNPNGVSVIFEHNQSSLSPRSKAGKRYAGVMPADVSKLLLENL